MSLLQTCWKNQMGSVKTIRYQVSQLIDALLTLNKVSLESKTKSESKSLANHEVKDFEFLLVMVIWYDVLFVVNSVSKLLQAKHICINDVIQELEGLHLFYKI